MQRILRAGDTLWSVSTFDPRKPVDEDWMKKPPAPILRSGDEEDVLAGSPDEHHHGTDAMGWTPESHGADEPDFDDYSEPEVSPQMGRPSVPDHDLRAIERHRRYLRDFRSTQGSLDGNDFRGPMVRNYPDSNVNHYYTYNPHNNDGGNPWVLNTMHWELREPISSRHPSFETALAKSIENKHNLEARGIS